MLHHHVAYGHAEDRCTQQHCLTHQMFAMSIVEKVLDVVCSQTLSLLYRQFVRKLNQRVTELLKTVCRVSICLENLEMSGNLTAGREMSGILRKVREVSWKISCQGKVA